MKSLGDGIRAVEVAFQDSLRRRDWLLDFVCNLTSPGADLPAIAHREGVLLSALAKTIREFPEQMRDSEIEQAVRHLRRLIENDE